ncbi:MAG: DNA polymerase III subunit delta [Anaerovoracaceae bacterium]
MGNYSDLKKKEHAFQQIGKDIRKEDISNILLLCGEEQYLVHWSMELIINKYVDEAYASLDVTKLEGERLTMENIKESCETLSMFSRRRIVILQDFPPAIGEKLTGFSDKDEADLIEYIQDVPDSSILIITGNTSQKKDRKKPKIETAIGKVGKVYNFEPLMGQQLKAFIIKRFKNSEKFCRESVLRVLIEDSGYTNKDIEYNLYNLENDIKKIIAHSKGDEIIASDVALTISTNMETNIFAMLDAISRNRKDEAYRLLHNLLVSGEGVYKLLALISSQVELILDVKEMREEGKDPKQIQKRLGIHEFRVKKALGFSGRYSIKELKLILTKVYEIDGHIKTGLLEPNLALELFIAEI